jgi:NADPH:quinone reductase-like Zn-dependent oxidoreductase
VEEAASIPVGLVTPALAMYNAGSQSLGLTPPWTARGRNQYAGRPFIIFSAASSVGQFGKPSLR